jgi:hypothetical protein
VAEIIPVFLLARASSKYVDNSSELLSIGKSQQHIFKGQQMAPFHCMKKQHEFMSIFLMLICM